MSFTKCHADKSHEFNLDFPNYIITIIMSLDNNSNNAEESNIEENNNIENAIAEEVNDIENSGSGESNSSEESIQNVHFEEIAHKCESEKRNTSIAAAAVGVYNYLIFLALGVPYFILSFFAGVSEGVNLLINLSLLFLVLFGSYFIYKSMVAFYRISKSVVPEGKIIIISSWVAFFLYIGIDILATLILGNIPVNTKAPEGLPLTIQTVGAICAVCLSTYSFYSFALFIYRLAAYYLPKKPSGIIAAILFIFFYYIAMMIYVNKLYQYFAEQSDYKEYKKEYAQKSQEPTIS